MSTTPNGEPTASITRVVLTGGPCAGKTTILSEVKEHFTALGYHVYLVPEAATVMINTGFIPAHFPGDHIYELQDAILEVSLTLYAQTERLVRHLARYPALIVYDRGNLDAKAYCTPAAWERVLALRGVTDLELRDRRYDGVIHLVTAADGARDHYSLSNNAARLETWEEALEVDRRVRESWEAHPRFHIIDNSTAFEGKIRRALDCIASLLPPAPPAA